MLGFDAAFMALIDHEGGYVDDPDDRGGETKFGISKRSYPRLDIKALTLEGARKIYLQDFWLPLGCDLYEYDLAFAVFDAAVNSGRSAAAKWLQAAVGVRQDAIIGPVTRSAIAAQDTQAIIARFNGHRLRAMTDFATWEHHGKGWARRIAANLQAVKG